MMKVIPKNVIYSAFLILFFRAMPLSARIEIADNDLSGFRLSYSAGEANIDTLLSDDHSYLSFSYSGHSFQYRPGAPQLPEETVYFVAPSNVTPGISITAGSTTNYATAILIPIPEQYADPTGNTVLRFNENPEMYARSGWQPLTNITLEPTVTEDSITVWRITLSPLRFDAYRNIIEETDGFEIVVTFPGSFDNLTSYSRIPSYAVNEMVIREQIIRSGPLKPTQTDENPFTSGDWYKIKVNESGMYRISGADLAQAGFPSGTVPTDTMHLYYGGGLMLDETPSIPTTERFKEIAITVNDGNDGIFNTNDTLIFYGEALTRFHISPGDSIPVHTNYLYADMGENVYWLQVYQDSAPKRITQISGQPSQSLSPITSFRETLHLEPENYIEIADEYGAESGLEWYWEAIGGQTHTFTFNAPGRVYGTDAILRLGFRKGMSTSGYYNNHNIGYSVNGTIFHIIFLRTDYYSTIIHELSMESPLNSETNTLELTRYSSPESKNPELENVRFDWLEIEYNRELSLNGSLVFFHNGTGDPALFQVGNVTTSLVDIYDTTDPFETVKVADSSYNSLTKTLTFQINTSEDLCSRFIVVAQNQYKKAISIEKKVRTNLRNPTNIADYIIITYGDFYDSAVTLANWRAHDSSVDPLTTMVVDIEDIYDEFSWGVFDPVAIRDFLYYAWLNYNQGMKHVSYCCLFGDTTYRYKNISNQIEINYVPSYTKYRNWDGIITDDFFTWFDKNAIPEIALGRICVPDIDTAERIVQKTIAYERDSVPEQWHNRILYIADDEFVFAGRPDSSNLFAKDIEKLDEESNIPATFEREKILLIEYPMVNREKPAVTTDLFKEINEGCLLIDFVGHGNNDVLAHEHILSGSRDIEKFTNGSRLPVFLTFSCTVGKFDKPGIASLTESMHLKSNGGCIAAISSARTTYNTENMVLNKQFFIHLFDTVNNPETRLGPALYRAKQDLASPTANNSAKYFLFGDPATRLMIPRTSIIASVPDTLDRLQPFNVSGTINKQDILDEDIILHVTAYGPKQHIVYKNPSNDNITFPYTKPGHIFFRGDYVLNGSNLDLSLIVPKDVGSDLTLNADLQLESKILLYASCKSFEATGAIENFYIGDIDSEAPVDTEGPSINVSFDNKVFESGDIIRRQPALTVEFSDPSGINIVGNRGHNINMLIDRTESFVLTDYYVASEGIASGKVNYTLPLLSVGEHEFEVSAYDSYNNTSKIAVNATVAGSETGDISIQNLLNYPNPMAYDGTTFTFNLTDYAQHAVIRIYSQSGRLVDSIAFPADYGFNKVYWIPPVVLANGVYFYKLSVTSSNGRKSSKIEKLVVMR